MATGAYILILWLSKSQDITIGKLGTFFFGRGFYAYVGSAMGAAGFKRVFRHVEISTGRRKIRKWHIDFLLTISEVIKIIKIETRERIECRLAHKLLKNSLIVSVKGFGSSDCRCNSHLFYSQHINELEDTIKDLIHDINREMQGINIMIERLPKR